MFSMKGNAEDSFKLAKGAQKDRSDRKASQHTLPGLGLFGDAEGVRRHRGRPATHGPFGLEGLLPPSAFLARS